jgi:G:T/U-mismatch repair DNA glycosylase
MGLLTDLQDSIKRGREADEDEKLAKARQRQAVVEEGEARNRQSNIGQKIGEIIKQLEGKRICVRFKDEVEIDVTAGGDRSSRLAEFWIGSVDAVDPNVLHSRSKESWWIRTNQSGYTEAFPIDAIAWGFIVPDGLLELLLEMVMKDGEGCTLHEFMHECGAEDL